MRGVYERVPGSGVWWIRYADADGKERREKAGANANAQKLLHKRKQAVLERRKLPENLRHKEVTFASIGQAAIDWYEHNGMKDCRNFTARMNVLVEAFGTRPADQISPAEIERWLARNKKWSPATRNRFKNVMSKAFTLAMRDEKLGIRSNPARVAAHVRENNERVRYVTAEEERKLVKAITEIYPAHLSAFLIAIHTGMRQGEQFTLKWRDVDLEDARIELKDTKNGRPRYIPLNSIALDALTTLYSKKAKDDLVFRSARYKTRAIRDPKRWWQAVLAKAEVTDLRWHDLRHTFCSRLVQAGVDIRTVAELAGHRNISVTMRYAHLAPEGNQAAVEKLVAQ